MSDLRRVFREMAGLKLQYDPEGSTRAIPERLYGEVLEQLSLAMARRAPASERGEREPDGYITPSDVARIRRGDESVPSVHVWGACDPGDHPIYIGASTTEEGEDG